ncbi:hypothetical protein D3C71_1421830 [compost metagenome]
MHVDVAVFQLDRHVVLVVDDDRVEHRLARADVQRLCLLAARRFLGQPQHAAVVAVVAPRDLIGDVVDGEQRRARLRLGDKGAHALHAHQQALGGQLAQGAVDGHAAETQLVDQLGFRGYAVVGGPGAAADLLRDHLLDLRIERGRRSIDLDRQSGRGSGHGNVL